MGQKCYSSQFIAALREMLSDLENVKTLRAGYPELSRVMRLRFGGSMRDGRGATAFLPLDLFFFLALPVLWSELTAAIREATDSPIETFIVPNTQLSS